MKNLFSWSKKYIHIYIIIIILNTLLLWLFSYLPFLVAHAFSVIYGNKDGQGILPNFLIDFLSNFEDKVQVILMIGLIMVLIQLIRAIISFISSYMEGKLEQDIQKDMRQGLYLHIQEMSYTNLKKQETGDLIQRCTSDISTSSSFLSSRFILLIDIIATIIIASIRLNSISSILMIVSLINIPLIFLSGLIYSLVASKEFDANADIEAKLLTTISENINSNKVVKAFSNEKFELEKMAVTNEEQMKSDLRLGHALGVYWGVNDFISTAQLTVTVLIGTYLGINGTLTFEGIATAIFLIAMIIWPVRGLGRIIDSFSRAKVASKRMQEILDIKSDFHIDGDTKPKIKGNIEFKNVCFKFDDDDKHFLDDISFKVKRGQTVALMGKTGSGKSTITNILTRLVDVNLGEVLIDDINIKDIKKKHLRKNIKIVLQEPFLFSQTIEENISLGNDEVSFESVKDAAKLAHIHKDIKKFSSGYKTLVGEKGSTLSGGQKQRMAIARVLVDDSPILIFDDSLSALDSKTDLMIRQSLKERKKDQTLIIVTHKTTSAKEADIIIVLDNGKVQAIGNHDTLSNQDGLYKDLWDIQGKLEEEFKELLSEGE